LYIYAGEDLPQPLPADTPAANDAAPVPVSAAAPPAAVPARTRPGVATITKSQQAQIHKVAVEVNVSLERLLSYFGVRELKDIAATDFLRVIRSLEKRRAAA
jgi:hypothetical protein